MKRYALVYVGDGNGPLAGAKAGEKLYRWGQFPAIDKADAQIQAQRIAAHHNLAGNIFVSYIGKWSGNEDRETYVGRA